MPLVIPSNLAEAENIVLEALKTTDHPINLNEVVQLLSDQKVSEPTRLAKEAIWKLAEEGKVRFTKNWSIEAGSLA